MTKEPFCATGFSWMETEEVQTHQEHFSSFDSSQLRSSEKQDFCSFPRAFNQVLRRHISHFGCFSSLPSDQIELYGKEMLFLYLQNIPISVVILIIIICRIIYINNIWQYVLFGNYPHQVFMIDYLKTLFIMLYWILNTYIYIYFFFLHRRKMCKEFRRMVKRIMCLQYILLNCRSFILNLIKLLRFINSCRKILLPS